jgi:arginyl-tRNA synthetase
MGDREIGNKKVIADQVAVGALKYTVLRQALGGDIVYEPEKMTNLEGNTGPFIQYTHARAKSILRRLQNNQYPMINNQTKSNNTSNDQKVWNLKLDDWLLNTEELSVLRWLYRYPEVVAEAGANYAPHLVSTYIYELASRFNSFYQACRVEENGEVNALRYELTKATANVLKNGLGLLGIQAPAEM